MAAEGKTRVVLFSRIAKPPVIAQLKTMPDFELIDVETAEEVVALVPTIEAILCSDPRGDEGRMIAAALRRPDSKVKLIQVLSAGYDGIMAHKLPPGVHVTNQGGAVAPAVAEHAVAMLLAMSRHMGDIIAATRRGEWVREFKPPMMSMENRTLVIVGMGHIGRQLARRMRGFDCGIVGVTRSGNREELADETLPISRLHEALGRGDMIALTVASSAATYRIMNDAAFAACKKGALFTNVTRGETVDQAALKRALESGQLAGAAIDVTDPEPLPPGDPLWSAPNIIISPHTAGGGGTGTGGRIAKVVAENLNRLRAGQPPIHQVKP